MEIRNEIRDWAKEYNRQNKLVPKYLAAGFGGLFFLLATLASLLIRGAAWWQLVTFAIGAYLWVIAKQYTEDARLPAPGRDSMVPDSLLCRLADSTTLSDEAKRNIAHVASEQKLRFGDLYDVEDFIANARANAPVHDTEGFKKISRFLDENRSSAKI